MSNEPKVKWMQPEEVPPVKQGCKETYWVAVKASSSPKEVVFSADYYNVPENEEECQEEAIGWFFEDWDGDINIIPFCETYQLLGWAEYRPPRYLTMNEQDKKDCDQLHKFVLNFQHENNYFGISAIQRYCGVGYNDAFRIAAIGIEKGIFIKDKYDPWKMRFAKND